MSSETTTITARDRRPFVGHDREREAYERLRAGLLTHAEGRFIVLVGDEMIGPFEDHEGVERAGYSRFGLGPLFIKQILAEDRVIEVTRFVAAYFDSSSSISSNPSVIPASSARP